MMVALIVRPFSTKGVTNHALQYKEGHTSVSHALTVRCRSEVDIRMILQGAVGIADKGKLPSSDLDAVLFERPSYTTVEKVEEVDLAIEHVPLMLLGPARKEMSRSQLLTEPVPSD
jgi:hypothetical protein